VGRLHWTCTAPTLALTVVGERPAARCGEGEDEGGRWGRSGDPEGVDDAPSASDPTLPPPPDPAPPTLVRRLVVVGIFMGSVGAQPSLPSPHAVDRGDVRVRCLYDDDA
jgi:hypothetical protein